MDRSNRFVGWRRSAGPGFDRAFGPAIALMSAVAITVLSPEPLASQDRRGVADSLLARPARLAVANFTLAQAVEELGRRSGVSIAFSVDLMPADRRVSCPCGTLTVAGALDRLLQGTDLQYLVLGAQVLIAPAHRVTTSAEDLAEVVNQLCGPEPARRGWGVVTGFVRHAATNAPVVDARVVGTWPAISEALAALMTVEDVGVRRGEAVTDGAGVYAACGVPLGTPVVFHAASGDSWSDFIEMRFDSGGVFVAGTFRRSEVPLIRRDFQLAAPSQRTAAVAGVVLETEMEPLAGATVGIRETDFQTTTGADGSFTLTNLPAGPVRLTVRHPGFRPQIRDIELHDGEIVTLAPGVLHLEALAAELAPVIVEGQEARTRRPLREFWERRESTNGSFITREEFEERGNPQKVTDVLRTMRGVRVVPNPGYGSNSLIRWRITMNRAMGPRSFELQTGPCYPLFFMDHLYVGTSNEFDVDNLLPLVNVEAIEAYSGMTAPREFARPGFQCGVIAFWTR